MDDCGRLLVFPSLGCRYHFVPGEQGSIGMVFGGLKNGSYTSRQLNLHESEIEWLSRQKFQSGFWIIHLF
jgi:hypothetical protein